MNSFQIYLETQILVNSACSFGANKEAICNYILLIAECRTKQDTWHRGLFYELPCGMHMPGFVWIFGLFFSATNTRYSTLLRTSIGTPAHWCGYLISRVAGAVARAGGGMIG